MKEDPERLLSVQSGADPMERELLASVQRVGPPAGAKQQVWRGLAQQIAAGAVVGAAVSSASTAAASSAAVAKAGAGALLPGTLATKVALTLAAGGVALGGYLAAQRAFEGRAPAAASQRPEQRVESIAHGPRPAREAALPAAAAEQVESARAPQRPLRRAGGPSSPDLLAAESALLAAARAQLRSGDTRAAHTTLARLSAQFPRGVLVQEREVLAIELLAARGDAAAARRSARAFVATYPNSPHSAKLDRFLNPP